MLMQAILAQTFIAEIFTYLATPIALERTWSVRFSCVACFETYARSFRTMRRWNFLN